jgi:hypothetical protein
MSRFIYERPLPTGHPRMQRSPERWRKRHRLDRLEQLTYEMRMGAIAAARVEELFPLDDKFGDLEERDLCEALEDLRDNANLALSLFPVQRRIELLRRTKGCTPQEAEARLAKADELERGSR